MDKAQELQEDQGYLSVKFGEYWSDHKSIKLQYVSHSIGHSLNVRHYCWHDGRAFSSGQGTLRSERSHFAMPAGSRVRAST